MSLRDAVIIGAGLSGTSLACHLLSGPTGVRSLTVVDPDPLAGRRRAWGYWSETPHLVDRLAVRSWDHVRVHLEGEDRRLDLAPYRYRLVRSEQLRAFAWTLFDRAGDVRLVQGLATDVRDVDDGVEVDVGDETVRARWAFDSRPRAVAAAAWLRFTGWQVVTQRPAFDAATPTLFDFRTPQDGLVRFVYVLPLAADRALVEHTTFSGASAHDSLDAEAALDGYLTAVLRVGGYTVVGGECGLIPLGPVGDRRLGRRVLAIGTAAGRVKASTGYGFAPIQRDSAAVADSLVLHGHPFDLPRQHARHRYLDRVFLRVLSSRPDQVPAVFGAMFEQATTSRSLRFLDEDTSWLEEGRLIAELPWSPFVRAAVSG